MGPCQCSGPHSDRKKRGKEAHFREVARWNNESGDQVIFQDG